jgi:hypothetical protein
MFKIMKYSEYFSVLSKGMLENELVKFWLLIKLITYSAFKSNAEKKISSNLKIIVHSIQMYIFTGLIKAWKSTTSMSGLKFGCCQAFWI